MPTDNTANHRHKWGVSETTAQREARQRLQAEYDARRKRIDEALAQSIGRPKERDNASGGH